MTSRETCAASAVSAFRNLRRAGKLKNRSATSTSVPSGAPISRTDTPRPASMRTSVPMSAPRSRVRKRKRETEAIDGNASPRKPSVRIAARSEASRILLVAWRSTASAASSLSMPSPSSSTDMRRLPPNSMVMAIRRAPASTAFSTSSLTTEAGRSITSPAAIWFARSGGRRWTRLTATPAGGTARASSRKPPP